MSKVYVPQLPSRFDSGLQLWVPSVNIKPAEKYGEIEILLAPNLSNMMVSPLVAALKEKLTAFGPDDFLVAVGDPTLIAASAGIALKKTGGRLKLLKWDRQAKDYLCAEIVL